MRFFTHYRFFLLLLMAAAACSCGEKSANPRSKLPDIDAIFFDSSNVPLGEEYKRPSLRGYHNEDRLITLLDGNYLRTWRAEFEGTEGPTQLLFYQVVSDAGKAVSEQRAIPLVGLVVDFDLLPLSPDRWIASAVTLAHVEEPTYSINTYMLSGSGEIIDQLQSTYSGIFTGARYFQIIPTANASCVSVLAYAHAQPICIDQGDTLVAHESIAIPSLDSGTNYVWHHNGKNFVYTANRQEEHFAVQVYDARWGSQEANIELGQEIYRFDSTHIEDRGDLVLISWRLNEEIAEDYEWVLFDGSNRKVEPVRGRLTCAFCVQSKSWLPRGRGLIPFSKRQFLLAWQSRPLFTKFPPMSDGFNLVLFDWKNQWNSQPLFVPVGREGRIAEEWSVATGDSALLLSWIDEREVDTGESYPAHDYYRKSRGVAFDLFFPQTDVPAHRQLLNAEHWQLSQDEHYQQAVESFFAGRFKDAREQFKRTAELGDRRAEYAYSRMLMHGVGGEQDIKAGQAVLEQLIADENPTALSARAHDFLLHRTLGIEHDETWSNYAAAVGSADAQVWLANDLLRHQHPELWYDDSKKPLIYQWLHNAAVHGDPTGQYLLAAWLHQGIATEVDQSASQMWLNRAADNGDPQAQYELRLPVNERFAAVSMLSFTYPDTPERARLIASAESGNPDSMMKLANTIYADDPDTALAWLKKAYEANSPNAASAIGFRLYAPEQPAADREMAAFWYHTYIKDSRQYLTDQQVMEHEAAWRWAISVKPEEEL